MRKRLGLVRFYSQSLTTAKRSHLELIILLKTWEKNSTGQNVFGCWLVVVDLTAIFRQFQSISSIGVGREGGGGGGGGAGPPII